ncbi:diiron oxygenase [Microbulbifer rhizosphaerae]|uniref:p-aminobenzoate N-oxygenase AurF n=1 Tax=Microbulbifer rhizosphaerae TaxID=1562603 RepID=A0A7W4WCZ8_9GAMM|nr:diiron oxygenase [Microbulbifer rhizosphaerae]MBB3061937.1 hypothetical protein [Microbulbifer rhizosphaerae]
MISELQDIATRAHIDTIHPNALPWPEAFDDAERDFLSRLAFGEPGHEEKAVVYITKELAQLAEIEKHVTGVLSIVLSELQREPATGLNAGHTLHHALSCFAAEELHHANMFYLYVRLLSGRDFKYPENLYAQRVGLYQSDESPWVKLAALCCSAYIGESVITVFERRCRALDPEQRFFFTQLLVAHGLDEARHIKVDHFVFDHVIPALNSAEQRRMRQILHATEDLNTELAIRFAAYAKDFFSCDYTGGNRANEIQMQLTAAFRELVFGGEIIRKVDDAMNDEHRQLLAAFCSETRVHGAVA